MNPSKEVFIETIIGKMPQAQPEILEAFYDFHNNQGCPRDFLEKVSKTFRYISLADFRRVAEQTVPKLEGVKETGFNLLVDSSNRSMRWAYEKLLEAGLSSANNIFNYLGNYEGMYLPWEYLLEYARNEKPVVIPDDWTIGGSQLANWAKSLGVRIPDLPKLYVVPFFASKNALATIQEANPAAIIISQGEPISTLDEVFNKEDYDYMEDLYNQSQGPSDYINLSIFTRSALVTSEHFTPDNFPGLLLGKRRFKDTRQPIPGLIKPQNPNYRRKTYSNSLHGKQ